MYSFRREMFYPLLILDDQFDVFANRLLNNELSDKVIENTVIKNRVCFNIDIFSNKETRKLFKSVWTNEQFLRCIIRILDNDELQLSIAEEHCINIFIGYYYKPELYDTTPVQLLLDIMTKINKEYIRKLINFVSIEDAVILVLAARCVMSEIDSMLNLNRNMITLETRLSVNTIINIYFIFYENSFDRLFFTSMTRFGNEQFANDNERIVYNNISMALLEILNVFNENDIYCILKSYVINCNAMGIYNVRFSLRNLARDYDPVNIQVARLDEEGYYVP